jgi:exosome complex RNA-binding protein Rrp42 (RNase PH superfamily)
MYTTSRKVKHINLEELTITCEHGFFVYVIVVILHSNAVLVSMLLVPSALVALKPIELMTSEDYLGQNLL